MPSKSLSMVSTDASRGTPLCDRISIRGAREHNLKGIDVDIPHRLVTVVTGVSGSGKSTLVFDVVFRESRRRYVESLSSDARRRLGLEAPPDADSIEGLIPAIAFDRDSSTTTSRSTVGTLSGIHDELRLLFAREGVPHCSKCREVHSLWIPVESQTVGQLTEKLLQSRDQEKVIVLASVNCLPGDSVSKTLESLRLKGFVRARIGGQIQRLDVIVRMQDDLPIEVVIDRLLIERSKADRLREALENARESGFDRVGILDDSGEVQWESLGASCPRCEASFPTLEPRLFSFYSKVGRCAQCQGSGFSSDSEDVCDSCRGTRLSDEARAVRISEMSLDDLLLMRVDPLRSVVSSLDCPLGEGLINRIDKRLHCLSRLGIDYLTMERSISTLSVGERQRVRLANPLGSGLQNVLYLLDEPSRGLHSRDIEQLETVLHELCFHGNTVVCVDHDLGLIESAGHIIDLGPGAGIHGGRVIAEGSPTSLIECEGSITGRFLAQTTKSDELPKRRKPTSFVTFRELSVLNLKIPTLKFPLGVLVGITGVSGSGKSTLVERVIIPKLADAIHGSSKKLNPMPRVSVKGSEEIERIVAVDQSPFGRSPQSTPATYSGVFQVIRELFSKTEEARARGYGPRRFSFNVKGGRCESCSGNGVRSVPLHILPDAWVTCDECKGSRYQEDVLDIRFKGMTIADVLALPVDEAMALFESVPKVNSTLRFMNSIGLGYLRLGQSATTLSGGESQRLKLAKELARPSLSKTLYILDEPTCGLHSADIECLMKALNHLVDQGHSVAVIEHQADVIRRCDWLLDLGPEGGERGGELIAEGTPEQVTCTNTPTGQMLKRWGERRPRRDSNSPSVEQGWFLRLKGASTHNLKSVSLEIPHDRWTGITGVSGAGKTSLAFETIFVEGQRRFIESLSMNARQEIAVLEPAVVESIDGLRPSVGLDTRVAQSSSRGTLASSSDMDMALRVLFARSGQAYCPRCDEPIRKWSPLDASRMIVERFEGKRVLILSPIYYPSSVGPQSERNLRCSDWKDFPSASKEFIRDGFFRLRVDEQDWNLQPSAQGVCEIPLTPSSRADLVMDRVIVHEKHSRRLIDSLEQSFLLGAGLTTLAVIDGDTVSSVDLCEDSVACVRHGFYWNQSLTPSLFTHDKRLDDASRRARNFVKLSGISIDELRHRRVSEVLEFVTSLRLDAESARVVRPLIISLQEKLKSLLDLGVGYLRLDRRVLSLSHGEAQAVRLASVLGAALSGVLYVLDEPAVGLHPENAKALAVRLRELVLKGNTLLVADTSNELLQCADDIIELGPGGGFEGGEVIGRGPWSTLIKNPSSVSARAYSNTHSDRQPRTLSEVSKVQGLEVHNLKSVDFQIPQGALTLVTGISGSGKTSLVMDGLGSCLNKRKKDSSNERRGPHLEGFEKYVRVVMVGRQAVKAHCPAEVLGLLDTLGVKFAASPQARARGFNSSRFQLKAGGGRCEACQGRGWTSLQLPLLGEKSLRCEACEGTRYDSATRDVHWRGLSIHEVLSMSLKEAHEFLSRDPNCARILESAIDLGLDSIILNQPIESLATGEVSRLRLARELGHLSPRGTLFLLDEPTVGLHRDDIISIIMTLQSLIERGATVVAADHSPRLWLEADWLIDLGPGAGDDGGRIVFEGTVEDAIKTQSATGLCLSEFVRKTETVMNRTSP